MTEAIFMGLILLIGILSLRIYVIRTSNNIINFIEQAQEKINSYFNFSNGYFNLKKLTNWRKDYSLVLKQTIGLKLKSVFFNKHTKEKFHQIKEINSKAESLRIDFNQRFIKNELHIYRTFFDNVEGRKLDHQQRTAIVTDEDNNLVVAGAGSGKTTTIIGKVNYVLKRYDVRPEDILLISFTNKSCDTLASRINIKGIDALTFHKFGLDTIIEAENKKPSLFDEDNFKKIIIDTFNSLIKQKEYLNVVVDYFLHHLKIDRSIFDFKNQKEHIQYLKDMDFKAYIPPTVPSKGKVTYNYEVVKSIQECKIANFLFFNRVFYFYERPYPFDTATSKYTQYRPDFTIVKDVKKIEEDEIHDPINALVFLEHFGVDRKNNIPKFFAEPNETYEQAKKMYLNKMEWARMIHRLKRTKLVETYSYEFDETIASANLTKKLSANGVKLDPMSSEEIWEIISKTTPKDLENFYNLIGTFIVLMKSNNTKIDDVRKKASHLKIDQLKIRSLIFLNIVEPIYKTYEETLKRNNQIDFSDMINKASTYFAEKKILKQFRYIIIDEFQDISLSRYRLVKSVRECNEDCKIFCVGDDWQSIYRFTGSDIGLFKEFSNYFGFTTHLKIETTYRFSNPLLDISSEFIMKNPNQTPKNLSNPNVNKKTNYKIIRNNSIEEGLITVFKELTSNVTDLSKKEILILGRYNFDFTRLRQDAKKLNIGKDSVKYQTNHQVLKATLLTVHRAKGLEADIIIIINCKAGQYGFPSQISDDPVLNLLLSDADQYDNSEERRLFYVALTRAKEHVFLIAPEYESSKFIPEIDKCISNSNVADSKICPKCIIKLIYKEGISKDGNKWAFWGCPNYRYGCKYIEWIPRENLKSSNKSI
ncbi:MAG: UvrD-helicase domain-containing protein [bacterium]